MSKTGKGPPPQVIDHLIDVHTNNGTLDKLLHSGIGDVIASHLQHGFLPGFTPATGMEPWLYDGGTQVFLIADINPGPGDSFPSQFITFDGDLYFTAFDPVNGFELRKLDGADGSVSVIDLTPGPANSDIGPLTVFNGDLYFAN